ncbi:MAG: helicase associated domain-containing protein [Arthrobacter sp.]
MTISDRRTGTAQATRRHNSAPNEERVLMYRGGLPGHPIAELADVPVSTVSYHLRLARAADPELRPAHEKATQPRARVTRRGLERMQELITMVRETGRYPSRNASDTPERSLAGWLQRRREDYRAGTLAPVFRDGLAVLPGWEGRLRGEADEERWQERLAALKEYRAAGNDWPRHKAVITGEEHDLGVWLYGQRIKYHGGKLDARRAALDAAVPGWRTGRKRGGRATASAAQMGVIS